MYRVSSIVLLLITLISFESSAQSHGKIIVKARVLDSLTTQPLGFATIKIFDGGDKLITGNISNEKGDISVELAPGKYYAVIDFMGYTSFNIPTFKLSKEQQTHDLGQI